MERTGNIARVEERAVIVDEGRMQGMMIPVLRCKKDKKIKKENIQSQKFGCSDKYVIVAPQDRDKVIGGRVAGTCERVRNTASLKE